MKRIRLLVPDSYRSLPAKPGRRKTPMKLLRKSALTAGILLFYAASLLEADNVPLFQETLDALADSHYASGISTLLGNFTWEDTGIGTEFSGYLQEQVDRALAASDYYNRVRSAGPVFNNPEAALIIGPDHWSGAGYLTWGNFRTEESTIIVEIEVFSFIFNQTVGRKAVKLPLSSIPPGIRIVPEVAALFRKVDSEVGDLYSESSLKIHVTTGRGDGGVYQTGEALELFILASRDCYIKIFHINSTGTSTTRIFPNQYESNNFLPGGRLLRFPGPQGPFVFRLTPPLGTEYIKIVAGEEPFSDSGKPFQDLGMATRGLFLEEAPPLEQGDMAEAEVSFTIIP